MSYSDTWDEGVCVCACVCVRVCVYMCACVRVCVRACVRFEAMQWHQEQIDDMQRREQVFVEQIRTLQDAVLNAAVEDAVPSPMPTPASGNRESDVAELQQANRQPLRLTPYGDGLTRRRFSDII